MRVPDIRFGRTPAWVLGLMYRGLKYALGFPLIFVASYAAASFLNDVIFLVSCRLHIQICIPMPGIDSLGQAFVERQYSSPVVIQVLALAYVPPFLAITLLTALLRGAQAGEARATWHALIVTIIGLVIGAVYAATLFVLHNQPTGFDFAGFWDGRSSLFISVPPLKAVDGTAIFGAVAAFLICRLTLVRSYNALERMRGV